MSAAALTRELHAAIPLTAAMRVRALECTGTRVRLAAPLAPNINIHGTGFAGSLATLATLCGWCLARQAGLEAGLQAAWVVRQTRGEFLAPARGPLLARAELESATWRAFEQRARRRRHPRLQLTVRVTSREREVLILRAAFVALMEWREE